MTESSVSIDILNPRLKTKLIAHTFHPTPWLALRNEVVSIGSQTVAGELNGCSTILYSYYHCLHLHMIFGNFYYRQMHTIDMSVLPERSISHTRPVDVNSRVAKSEPLFSRTGPFFLK